MSLEARFAILDALQTVLDADHAEAVIEHRRQKKSPLTAFAAKLLAKQFAMCPDPNAAAEEMILRGWAGFKAEWIGLRTQRQSGKRNVVDAMNDIFKEKGWANEPGFIPGNNSNGQCVPAERDGSQGPVVDLREGTDWTERHRHH